MFVQTHTHKHKCGKYDDERMKMNRFDLTNLTNLKEWTTEGRKEGRIGGRGGGGGVSK